MLEHREGGCHCGRVRFRIRADLGTIGECNCSICTKKGILHLPLPLDRFELLCGEGDLTTGSIPERHSTPSAAIAAYTPFTCRAPTPIR